METEVLGSIPGVDRKLFFRSWQIISNWVSLTGTLDVGLFCLLLSLSFRVQFASITHIRFLPSPSSLRLMQSRAMLANVLCSLFSITLSLRTKPALLVSSGGRKKPNQTSTCYLNFDKMLSRPENNLVNSYFSGIWTKNNWGQKFQWRTLATINCNGR